jgi:hypothetical protein
MKELPDTNRLSRVRSRISIIATLNWGSKYRKEAAIELSAIDNRPGPKPPYQALKVTIGKKRMKGAPSPSTGFKGILNIAPRRVTTTAKP